MIRRMSFLSAMLSFLIFIRLSVMQAQENPKWYHFETEVKKMDVLKSEFGKNKKLPAGFELQALIALSYYPELRDEHVVFVQKKAAIPYASRPGIFSLLNPFSKKKYRVIISTKTNALRTPTLLENLDFNAQIGALGHELAHTAYYYKTRKLKILVNGIQYLDRSFEGKFEKMTDRIAIGHGLGTQIYTWCKAIFPVKKRDGKRSEIYYPPKAIFELLDPASKELVNAQAFHAKE